MSNKKIENRRKGGFGPGNGGPMGAVEKAKDFKGTMKNLGKYIMPYKMSIIFVIVLAIGSAAFSIVGPKILGKATTKLFEGLVQKVTGVKGASIDFDYIGKIIILLLVLYIISAIFSFVQGYIMSSVAQKISYEFRREISEKINRMPIKYFDN